MPMQGPSFLVLDLICYGIIKKAMGSYVKILIGRAQYEIAGEKINVDNDDLDLLK